MEHKQPTTKDLINEGVHSSNLGKGGATKNIQSEAVLMDVEPSGVLVSHHNNLHRNDSSVIGGMSEVLKKSMESLVGLGQPTYTMPMQTASFV